MSDAAREAIMKAKDLNQEVPSPRPAKRAKVTSEPATASKLSYYAGTDDSSGHQGPQGHESRGAAQGPREPPECAASARARAGDNGGGVAPCAPGGVDEALLPERKVSLGAVLTFQLKKFVMAEQKSKKVFPPGRTIC